MSRDYTVPSVAATVRVLRRLKDGRATLSQIARATSLSKSSAFAILKTLEQAGLLGCEASTRQYFLGVEVLSLGEAAAHQLDQVGTVKPLLRSLVEETRLTGIVAQNTHDRLVVVHKDEGNTEIRATMSLGQIVPAGVSAMGKVYAAYAASGSSRLPPSLQEVRRRGYSTSLGEYRLGVNAVAAPVFDHRSELALVLSLIGFASALPPEAFPRYGELIRRRGLEASRALGMPEHGALSSTEVRR